MRAARRPDGKARARRAERPVMKPDPGQWLDRLVRLSSRPGVSLAMVAAIALVDYTIPQQELAFLPRALVDEPCHLATALIVLGALTRWRGRQPSRPFSLAMLSASLLIDLDHLPLEFGSAVLTAGTPRPYTHALWVVGVLASVAGIAGRRARARDGAARAVSTIAAGAACGVGAHFLRDVATAPIALWWPGSSAGMQLPYLWYLAALLVLAILPPPGRRAGDHRGPVHEAGPGTMPGGYSSAASEPTRSASSGSRQFRMQA